MRFHKRHRHPFTDTSRKRSFIPIKHRREQEKFPLFAAEIAESQRPVDEIMADRAIRWERAEKEARSRHARAWINYRRALRMLPAHERHAWLEYYYRVRFPLDPGYMHATLNDFLRGRYVMIDGKVFSQSGLDAEAARAAKVRGMTEEELLRAMQSPYALPHFVAMLQDERRSRHVMEAVP